MPDALLEAVNNLQKSVDALQRSLEQYPKRVEIERKFVSKQETAVKRRQYAILILVMSLVSLIFSYGASITTISFCFLTAEARAGNTPDACQILPGFKEHTRDQLRLRKEFEKLISTPEKNGKRIDRIEKRLGIK